MKKVKFYILLIIFLFSGFYSKAQQRFTDKKRAEYIFYVATRIKWPDSTLNTNFNIGVVGKEDSILYYLNELRKTKHDSIYHLPVHILPLKNYNYLSQANLIYVHKRSGFSVDNIYKRIKGKHILLIGENFEFQSAMIGFVVVNDKRRFTVNTKLLDAEGFKAPRLFMALAIKTREQMEAEYKKSLQVLRGEIEKVKAHRREIHRQKAVIDSQKTEISSQITQLKDLKQNVSKQEALLAQRMQEIKEQEHKISKQKLIFDKQSTEIEKQELLIKNQMQALSLLMEKVKLQQIILILSVVFIAVMLLLAFFIYRGYRIKKEANRMLQEKNDAIEQQNAEILQQKEEILTQRDQIEEQRDVLAEQRQEIIDSIQYAKRIQEAVLTPDEVIDNILPQHFIIYHPRNIVSGDYYWATQLGDQMVIVAADCTGHGVPGAFMSMLGVSFLNEIVNRLPELHADIILNELRNLVIKSLHQTGEDMEQKDGMDMQLCIINKKKGTLEYSGANNPLFIVREKQNGKELPLREKYKMEEFENENKQVFQLLQIKADKMPIGIYLYLKPFTLHTINIHPNDQVYMFSDGLQDQFGGKKGRKFMSKQFKRIIIAQAHQDMDKQKEALETALKNWMIGWEQVDDILVLGLKI